jgi:cell division septation protein DedD
MSENGTDRELVLGNKQLLAIFFVAALLCGVFFAVGYVVGGNSAKSTGSIVADSSTAPPVEGKRDEPAGVAPVSDAVAATSAPAASDNAGAASGVDSKMSDNPAAAGSTPPPSTSAQAVAAPAQYVPPAKAAPAKTAPATSTPAPLALSVPETGASYVQVAAQTRPAADTVANSLRERGWPTILAESSKADRVEILVGPYRDGVALADAKRKLIDLGFSQAFVHKQQ